MKPRLSPRGQAMPASPIRKLAPLADAARRRGVRVLHLNIGQPDLETPEALRSRVPGAEKTWAYTPSGGTPEYVEALSGYYRGRGFELGPEELIATTGGSEALLFAFCAAAADGDEAIVFEPFYTNYSSFATLAGVRLVPIRTRGEDGFHLPPAETWKKALTERTRLLLLCNPNNPTGTVYTREEVEAAALFCVENGLFLVADEVYREFVYDGRQATSALSIPGCEENVVVVDSLSKRYSACGIRLGSLATRNRELHQAALRMAQGRLSPPGLAQLAAAGLGDVPAEYFESVATEYQHRRDVLFDGLTGIPGVFVRKPEGAFYFVVRLPVDDAEEFAKFLLAEFEHQGATVMIAPAAGFYATPGLGHDEARIAYVLNADDLRRAVAVLAAALPAYRATRGLGPVEAGAELAGRPSSSA